MLESNLQSQGLSFIRKGPYPGEPFRLWCVILTTHETHLWTRWALPFLNYSSTFTYCFVHSEPLLLEHCSPFFPTHIKPRPLSIRVTASRKSALFPVNYSQHSVFFLPSSHHTLQWLLVWLLLFVPSCYRCDTPRGGQWLHSTRPLLGPALCPYRCSWVFIEWAEWTYPWCSVKPNEHWHNRKRNWTSWAFPVPQLQRKVTRRGLPWAL